MFVKPEMCKNKLWLHPSIQLVKNTAFGEGKKVASFLARSKHALREEPVASLVKLNVAYSRVKSMDPHVVSVMRSTRVWGQIHQLEASREKVVNFGKVASNTVIKIKTSLDEREAIADGADAALKAQ